MTSTLPPREPTDAQKRRRGLDRILHATGYSIAGLKAAWAQAAFRTEAILAVFLVPAACWVGRSWLERIVLVASVLLVLIVELLNTGIEAAIDRIGPEWHVLSKQAKDMGSAAVFLSLVLCATTWISALVSRLI